MHTIDLATADYAGGFNISERDGDMQVSSFAKANGGRAYPRTRNFGKDGTTDCLCTRADGTKYRITKGTRKSSGTRKPATAAAYEPKTVTRAAPIAAASLMSDYDARHAVGY